MVMSRSFPKTIAAPFSLILGFADLLSQYSYYYISLTLQFSTKTHVALTLLWICFRIRSVPCSLSAVLKLFLKMFLAWRRSTRIGHRVTWYRWYLPRRCCHNWLQLQALSSPALLIPSTVSQGLCVPVPLCSVTYHITLATSKVKLCLVFPNNRESGFLERKDCV